MPGLAHQQRLFAANRKNQLHAEYENIKRDLDRYNSELAASAVCEQIALEAALSAVTMGAAGAIGRRLASAAVRSESLIAKGRGAKTIAAIASRTPGVTVAEAGVIRRLQATRAACMTLGRLIAGAIQLGARSAAGQDITWQSLAVGLLTAIGIPGPARAGCISATSSGAIVSWQGANVALGTLAKSLPAYRNAELWRSKECMALVESGVNLPVALQEKADELSKATVDYALETEGPLRSGTEAKVLRQDFSGKVPFLARHFSNASNHVRNYTARLTAISAQYQLWQGVYQNLVHVDRATMTARGMLPR